MGLIRNLILFLLGGVVYLLLPESCPEDAKRCAFILVLAAGFWAFEVFPVYVTSLIVVLLLSFLLNLTPYTEFLVPFGSPMIMLFFGGFILAKGVAKYQVDLFLASRVLNLFGASPLKRIFGIMLTTAFLSMWISNTAATLMMMGIAHPIYSDQVYHPYFRKGLVLSIPLSANIGGMGTPIGTPPNALAIGSLSDFGVTINFFDWMLICLPLVLICLTITFLIIYLFCMNGLNGILLPNLNNYVLTKQGAQVLVIGTGTVILWFTSQIHGIPEALVSLLCVGVLLMMNLISREDIKNIDWDILILMWGGLALGVGMEKSGLALWFVHYLLASWEGIYLVILFGTLAMILSLFISNTAAAALILPIAIEAGGDMKYVFGITVAIMCSIAMVFPISTPPNAIAFGTGQVSNGEMIRINALVTVCCYILVMLGFWWVIPYFFSL